MPTVIKQDGFLIMIMLNDHRPPHVHVVKDNGRARITLGSKLERPSLKEAFGMKDRDLKKSLELVIEHQEKLIETWEKYHGKI